MATAIACRAVARLAGWLVLAFALTSGAAWGQVLRSQTTWGGSGSDTSQGVAVARDGSAYLVALSDSFTFDQFGNNRPAISLVKFAPDGSLAWQKVWSGPTFQGGLSGLGGPAVTLSPDQEALYVTGLTSSNGNDAVLLKFDAQGALLWQRTWGGPEGEEANAVATDAQGDVYVVGATRSFGPSGGGLFVLKFNPAGALLWQKVWDGASGFAVAVAPDGHVYAAGSRPRPESFGSNFDVLVVKLAPTGTLVWSTTYSAGVQADPRGGMAVGADGGPIVAGALQAEKGGIVGIAALLFKLDAGGALAFDGEWGGREGAAADAVAVGPDGTIHVAGQVSEGDRLQGAFVLRADARGRGVSAATWGGAGFESGHGVGVASDGTVVLAATTSAGPPFVLAEASRRLSGVRSTVAAVVGTLDDTTGVLGDPAAAVFTPDGRTAYAGNFDAALVRFAP